MARTPDLEQRNRVWELSVRGRPTAQIHEALICEFEDDRAYQRRTIQKILILYHKNPEWIRQRKEHTSENVGLEAEPQFKDSESDFSLSSFESNGLPAEASGPLMDLHRIINSNCGMRFSKSIQYLKIDWCYAKWYWKLLHCTPGLTEKDRFVLSIVCCVKEMYSPESLEEVETYLTWQPWNSAGAHREYLRLINMDQIKYVNWLEWWLILHLIFDDSTEGIDKYTNYFDSLDSVGTPLILPHPELDPDVIEDIRQPLFTPTQGLAVVKLDLIFGTHIDIDWDVDPDVEDIYDTEPIEQLTQEALAEIRKEIASDWDDWIPYEYDYRELERFAQLLTSDYHAQFVWKNLVPILPERIIGDLGFVNVDRNLMDYFQSIDFHKKYLLPYEND
jgi:hypothetical protein